ncbi:unnamed protein product [Gadus morhua 'NCC']
MLICNNKSFYPPDPHDPSNPMMERSTSWFGVFGHEPEAVALKSRLVSGTLTDGQVSMSRTWSSTFVHGLRFRE